MPALGVAIFKNPIHVSEELGHLAERDYKLSSLISVHQVFDYNCGFAEQASVANWFCFSGEALSPDQDQDLEGYTNLSGR